MNPSTAMATALVDQLVRSGVTEAVLAPGSRSAPLAYALHAADAAGRLRLHVRIDERTAGFLALGLAKTTWRPVPVVTTSGTAAANLHPAVLEAAHSGVPLIAITADRPPELRGTGANQTTDQVKLFGEAVRLFADLAAPERRAGQVVYWRNTVVRAVAAAFGVPYGGCGPVHLNVALGDPLVPDGDPDWLEPLASAVGETAVDAARLGARPRPALPGRPHLGGAADVPWPDPVHAQHSPHLALPAAHTIETGPRTVVVAGDADPWTGRAARRLAESAGWPLLAEPTSGARSGPNALGPYRLLLDAALATEIERVVVYGRPTISRPVQRLLAREDVEVVIVTDRPDWTDPARHAALVTPALQLANEPGPGGWLRKWQLLAERGSAAVADVLRAQPRLTGPAVAQILAAALPDPSVLVVGASNPIRDLDLAAVPWTGDGIRVSANRGLAGIDGTLSTAVGTALASPGVPAYALIGDLTFLHDTSGLVLGPNEPRPDLCIVVLNDDGGGIFGLLEQGAPELSGPFERIFGTSHGADLAALCAATATPHLRANDSKTLDEALLPTRGLRVVEATLDRRGQRALHESIRAAVASAV